MNPKPGSSLRGLMLIAAAVVVSACAGPNLFSLAGSVGGSKPTVNITAPSDNLTLAAGAGVQVKAEVVAPNGLNSASYRGVYVETGANAYVAEIENFGNPPFASLDNTLTAVAGQTTGDVWIIVQVTDGLGETKADTVKVIIS